MKIILYMIIFILVVNISIQKKSILELEKAVRILDIQYKYLSLELSQGHLKNWQGEYLIQRNIKLKEKGN